MEDIRKQAKTAEITAMRRKKRKLTLMSVASIIVVLAVWQALVSFEIVDTKFFCGPIEIIKAVIQKITDNGPDGSYLHEHILASLEVVWIGFLLATVLGITLGLFMGWFKRVDRIVRPVFEVLRPIPPLAWIPVIIVFLGVGVLSRGVIIFFGAFVSIVLNTYAGVRSTNQTLINVAKTCGAKNFEIFVKVGIPSAMPMTFAGLRTAMGIAWGTIVAAEMLGSSVGLGYFIKYGRTYCEVDLIIAGILVLGICGQLSSKLIQAVERIVLKWRPRIDEKQI